MDCDKKQKSSKKKRGPYRPRDSLTPEERLERARLYRNACQKRYRDKRRRELGTEEYNRMQNEMRQKWRVKAADMPLDKLLAFRKKERERKRKVREKLKLQKQKEMEELK